MVDEVVAIEKADEVKNDVAKVGERMRSAALTWSKHSSLFLPEILAQNLAARSSVTDQIVQINYNK